MSLRRRAFAIVCCLGLGCSLKAKPDAASAPETATAAPGEAAAPEPAVDAGADAAQAPAQDFDAGDRLASKQSAPPSLAELSTELDGYESRLREQGVRLRGYPPGTKRELHKPRPPKVKKGTSTPATTPKKPRDRCEDVCELATAVCGLRDKICGLASVHESETEYEEACERAERDCGRASEACDDCS